MHSYIIPEIVQYSSKVFQLVFLIKMGNFAEELKITDHVPAKRKKCYKKLFHANIFDSFLVLLIFCLVWFLHPDTHKHAQDQNYANTAAY